MQSISDYLNGKRGKRRVGVVGWLLSSLSYMRSQVCVWRQADQHVYLKPLSGADQTFTLPASPPLSFSLCPSFYPHIFSSEEAACRLTPTTIKDKAGKRGGVCEAFFREAQVFHWSQFFM